MEKKRQIKIDKTIYIVENEMSENAHQTAYEKVKRLILEHMCTQLHKETGKSSNNR